MAINMVKLPTQKQDLVLRVAKGHFATSHSHINYYIDEVLDEDQQEEIYEFLMDADSDSMSSLLDEFGDDYDEEELRLMRIKFISEVAN